MGDSDEDEGAPVRLPPRHQLGQPGGQQEARRQDVLGLHSLLGGDHAQRWRQG